MHLNPQRLAGINAATSGNRRSKGRLQQEAVSCSLGTVLDLSAGGMRVLCSRKPMRDEVKVTIWGLGVELRLRAVVAWIKRRGIFSREIGLEFLDVDEQAAHQLTSLAMNNRNRRTM